MVLTLIFFTSGGGHTHTKLPEQSNIEWWKYRLLWQAYQRERKRTQPGYRGKWEDFLEEEFQLRHEGRIKINQVQR